MIVPLGTQAASIISLNPGDGHYSRIAYPFESIKSADEGVWHPNGGFWHEGTISYEAWQGIKIDDSHWVNGSSPSSWHREGDAYAEDWNLVKVSDLGQPIYSPITGKVLYSGDRGSGYGDTVIIQSDIDPNFAFRVAHLDERTLVANDSVSIGDEIGKIGESGTGDVHAHIALYKNLYGPYMATMDSGYNRLVNEDDLGFAPNSSSTATTANKFAAQIGNLRESADLIKNKKVDNRFDIDFNQFRAGLSFRSYVYKLFELGLYNLPLNENFSPNAFLRWNNLRVDEHVTRKEMARLIALARYKLDGTDIFDNVADPQNGTFSDVQATLGEPNYSDYYVYIQALRENNLIAPNSEFRPNDFVTFVEMASFIAKGFELKEVTSNSEEDITDEYCDISSLPTEQLKHVRSFVSLNVERDCNLDINDKRSCSYNVHNTSKNKNLLVGREPLWTGFRGEYCGFPFFTPRLYLEPDKLVRRYDLAKALLNVFQYKYTEQQSKGFGSNIDGQTQPFGPETAHQALAQKMVTSAPSDTPLNTLGWNFAQDYLGTGSAPQGLAFDDGTNEIPLFSNQEITIEHAVDFDEDGNELFFYWTVSSGQLQESSTSPNFRQVKYQAPAVTEDTDIKLFTVVGDGTGYAATDSFTLHIKTTPDTGTTPLPDYVINTNSSSASSAIAGEQLTFSTRVVNSGNALSAYDSRIGYFLSIDNRFDVNRDRLLGYSLVNRLNPQQGSNENKVITFPTDIDPGNYYILFVADYQNNVSESRENNNTRVLSFVVRGNPVGIADLVVEDITISNDFVDPGDSITLRSRVRNVGNSASPYTNIKHYLSSNNSYFDSEDIYLSTNAVLGLNPDMTSINEPTVTIPANTQPGNYYIVFYVDEEERVSENVESNNEASLPITVKGDGADLVLQSVNITSGPLVAGQSVSTNYQVTNSGSFGTSGSSSVGYYLSTDSLLNSGDTLLATSYFGFLAPNESTTLNRSIAIPSGLSSGSYYLILKVDYHDLIGEINEGNNFYAKSFTVSQNSSSTSLPEFVVQEAELEQNTAQIGELIDADVTVKNLGVTPQVGSDDTYVGFYLSTDTVWDQADLFLDEANFMKIYANEAKTRSARFQIPSNTTTGSYYVLIVVDHQRSNVESNEDNNVLFLPMAVTAVDFTITDTIINRDLLYRGQSIDLISEIANIGNGIFDKWPATTLYLSSDPMLDASDVVLDVTDPIHTTVTPELTIDLSFIVNLPTNSTPGQQYLITFVDRYQVADESNENNNYFAIPIQIGVNTSPNAEDDYFYDIVNNNTIFLDGILTNDNDDDGDTLLIANNDSVSAGGAAIQFNGINGFHYSPISTFSGLDSFTYTITDKAGSIDAATVFITIVLDPDRDGVYGNDDNCPNMYNTDQNNYDNDNEGDVCDDDADGDTYSNNEDSFPLDPNEHSDADGDGTGGNTDECDNDPAKIDPGVCGCGIADIDADEDGIYDCNDLCAPNKTLLGDSDADGFVELSDAILVAQLLTGVESGQGVCAYSDINNDGLVGMPELIFILKRLADIP